MVAQVRAVVLGSLVVAVSGCGSGGSHSTAAVPPRTVAQVEQAFAREGIRLRPALPVGNLPSHPTLFGPWNLTVEVYPSTAAASAVSIGMFIIGTGGTPHAAAVRNVVVEWTGRDRPAVRAAVARLG